MSTGNDDSSSSEQIYEDWLSGKFRFNDCVEITMIFGDLAHLTGRLVQVRKNAGAYGTDQFFIRRADGSLGCFENVKIEHSDREVPIDPDDGIDVEYTLKGKYPETGFVVEKPSQPQSYSPPFGITITKGSK